MRVFLFICLMMQAFTITAQDKQMIVGKWKIAVMYDESMYFDLTKDSLYLNEQPPDSIFNQTKILLHEYFGKAFIEFRADMSFIEYSGIRGERNGIYSLYKESFIKMVREWKSKVTGELLKNEEEQKYLLKDNRLIFLGNENKFGNPTIEFVKQ